MSLLIVAFTLFVVFVLVCAVSVFALEQTGLRDMKMILGPCVAMLSVLALLGRGVEPQKEPLVDVILIPYAVLPYSILFVLILWLLSRIPERFRKGSDGRYGRSARDERSWQHERHSETRDVRSSDRLAQNKRKIRKKERREFE